MLAKWLGRGKLVVLIFDLFFFNKTTPRLGVSVMEGAEHRLQVSYLKKILIKP
jgi:hypothetical protein